MAKNFNQRARTFSEKLFERLLLAYPKAHRDEYGAAMLQLFRDQYRDAWAESKNWGVIKLWLRVLPDWASTSIRERLAALNERKTMNDKLTSLAHDRTTPTAVFIRVFLAVFLITIIVATAITFILPETYASTARIKVESETPPADGQFYYDPYFTTFEIIQSELVLKPVIDKLKLNNVWGKRYFNGAILKTAETMELLKSRLKVSPVGNTQLISITAYSDDKKEAAQIANAVAESYLDYRVRSRAEFEAQGLVTLQEQYQSEEKQIAQSQNELDSLRQEFKITDDNSKNQLPQDKPYWNEKNRLTQMLETHKLLFAKIEAEKVDMQIAKTTLVQITDAAEPRRAPVKPNKPLNIFLGAVVGGFLGLVIGAVAAFTSVKFGDQNRKRVATA